MTWTDPLENLVPWLPKPGRQALALFLLVFAAYWLRLIIRAVF
jgi:hypothetical protein